MIIESLNNSKVKAWNKLKEKKFRDEENLFLIEGDHLVECALNYGVVKEIVTSNENFKMPNISGRCNICNFFNTFIYSI